jgi:hypothetical protein
MLEGSENSTREEFRGARVRVVGTDPDNPDEGRVFVWTKMGWFERVEGQSGGVSFIPVAQSENELHEFISRRDPSVDLVPLGGSYGKMVSEEFMEQSPAYSDSPEYSSEDPNQEDDQQYHQHDL